MTNSLIKRRPFNGGTTIEQMLNRFIEPAWYFEEDLMNTKVSNWTPRIDVKDEPTQFIIHADLPGVEAKDLDIEIENGVLTIKGQKTDKMEKKLEDYVRIERFSGSFYRSIALPEHVDREKIEAKINQGVLVIIAPKTQASLSKKIKVEG